MKVMEIIDRLNSHYHPDTELIVEWWDKEIVESAVDVEFLNDDEWAKVVHTVEEESGHNSGFGFYDYLYEVARSVVENG